MPIHVGKFTIPGEAHSDDHVLEVDFDAEGWFESASNAEICALASIGWGGDQEADVIALTLREYDEDLSTLFDYLYLRNNREQADPTIGFEVHINEAAAVEWLSIHRPQVLADLKGKAA